MFGFGKIAVAAFGYKAFQIRLPQPMGDLNLTEFQPNDSFNVTPIKLESQRQTELENHLMLFFTGFSCIASEVAQSKIANLHQRSEQLHRMRAQVDDALSLLHSTRDIRGFSEMLHQAWLDKRSLSDQVSNDAIDSIYDRARTARATGANSSAPAAVGF